MRKLAIDYTPAYEQTGGIGRYVRELTAALAQIDKASDYRLFVSGSRSSQLPRPPAANFSWKSTVASPKWLARIWHRARLPLPIEAFVGPVDLYHATDFVLPPTLPRTRTLLTVHDLSFVRAPEAASPQLKAFLDATVPRSVARADHILADSQATKSDLMELYGTSERKISVLLCGVDDSFQPVNDQRVIAAIRKKYSLESVDFLLAVGTVQPRKNYSRAIQALAQIRNLGHDLHLAIVGGKGWLEDEMYSTIENSGMKEYVHLLGYVDDRDLPALYSSARALLMVSLYEGFGLPIIEAMSCGTPVITSKVSSLPEVAGDAALLVDPYDITSITEAILQLESDLTLREALVEAGYLQARKFSWKRSAAKLKAIYDELLQT